MRSVRLLALVCPFLLVLALSACSPRTAPVPAPGEPPPAEQPTPPPADEAPPEAPPAAEEPADEPTPPPMPPEPEPADPLYVRPSAQMKRDFADALYTLYGIEASVRAARQLDRDEVRAWLADLDEINPEAVEFAMREIGDVLRYKYAVGYVLSGVQTAPCARMDEVLYVAVPERLRTEARAYGGFIVRDECEAGTPRSWCRVCAGGLGTAPGGGVCSCACTTGACPAVGCVQCGGG